MTARGFRGDAKTLQATHAIDLVSVLAVLHQDSPLLAIGTT